MIYHGASVINQGIKLTLSNLVPGTVYSTRFYYRNWSLTGPDASRKLDFKADGESNGTFSDVINVWLDAGGAHYVNYTFTADDTDVVFQFITTIHNYGVHVYGFTNEVVREPACASQPSPAIGQTDVLRDTALSWTPGLFAAAHDVYLGTSQEDVAAAGRADPRGVLVSQAQSADTFDPGRLAFGQTYYWRVDEVNAAPDNTIYAGKIWSFTVEPHSYTVTNLKVTASSFNDPNSQPEKTIDGSGLNATGQHSIKPEDMWLSSDTDPQPWIQYEFDRVQKLDQMVVWNCNQAAEVLFGLGAKDVTIEYSTDATTWKVLGDYVIGQAPGTEDYAGDTPVDFGGAVAKYVKLTIKSNWGGGLMPMYSLSEVRFSSVPMQARQPLPANNATNVAAMATLSWRYGRQAATHEVYLGTDPNALALAATVTDPSCRSQWTWARPIIGKWSRSMPPKIRPLWESDVWKFTAQSYITLDNFESYTNDSPTRVFQTWIDGVGFSPDEFFPKGNDGNGTGGAGRQ